jgi:hypothetical protein
MSRAAHGDLLGKIAPMRVRRLGAPGAFLAVCDDAAATPAPDLLLPSAEVPAGAKEGDTLHVFVHLDSEDRPVATLREPKVVLGEVAFLTVTDMTRFGAFFDWGLPKELLVPHAERTCELRVGDRYAIGLFVDDTGRLAGTMRVSEMLRDRGEFTLDEWVHGEALRDDPARGLFVIVERAFVGLVPRTEPHGLSRGDAGKFRVTNVLADGKIELSLRGLAHDELAGDAEKVLATLRRPRAPKVGDRSSPEEIRATFGLSKKAFKRAVGRLLKQGDVEIDGAGFMVSRTR